MFQIPLTFNQNLSVTNPTRRYKGYSRKRDTKLAQKEENLFQRLQSLQWPLRIVIRGARQSNKTAVVFFFFSFFKLLHPWELIIDISRKRISIPNRTFVALFTRLLRLMVRNIFPDVSLLSVLMVLALAHPGPLRTNLLRLQYETFRSQNVKEDLPDEIRRRCASHFQACAESVRK